MGEKQTHLSSLAGALKIRLMRERSRRNRTGASCTHSGAQRRGHRGDTQHLGSQSIQTETNEHCREAMRQGPGALHLSEWGLGEGKCTVPALSGATSGRLRTTPPFLVQRGRQRIFLHVCHFSTAFTSNKHVKVASLGQAYPDALQWSAGSLENTQNYV